MFFIHIANSIHVYTGTIFRTYLMFPAIVFLKVHTCRSFIISCWWTLSANLPLLFVRMSDDANVNLSSGYLPVHVLCFGLLANISCKWHDGVQGKFCVNHWMMNRDSILENWLLWTGHLVWFYYDWSAFRTDGQETKLLMWEEGEELCSKITL
jgi:hypothetical protein